MSITAGESFVIEPTPSYLLFLPVKTVSRWQLSGQRNRIANCVLYYYGFFYEFFSIYCQTLVL